LKPDISEFSYGYAITENLVSNPALQITAAPVFPSLFQEGQEGGGYDVKIVYSAAPLFLQFKLSDCLTRGNANEADRLGLPYYRFHIRSTKYSNQHPMLVELDKRGQFVFYAAPRFHLPDELNDAYLKRQIIQESFFIKPSTIGEFSDEEDHYVAFNESNRTIICSEPREIDSDVVGHEYFLRETMRYVETTDWNTQDRQSMQILLDELVNIVRWSQGKGFWRGIDPGYLYSNRPLLEQLSYVARIFFGCEILAVRQG
jgi:hypothetical protein